MTSLRNSLLQDLVAAVSENDEEHVRILLEQGISPDEFDLASDGSALHAAVGHHPALVRVLLPYSKHPDLGRVYGQTALALAIHEIGECSDPARRASLMEAIGLLLDHGANPEEGGDQSPLYLSRCYGLGDVEAILMRRICPPISPAVPSNTSEIDGSLSQVVPDSAGSIGSNGKYSTPLRLGLASSALLVAALMLEFSGWPFATVIASAAVVISAGLSSLGCFRIAIRWIRKSPMDHLRLSMLLNMASFLVSWALVFLMILVFRYAMQIDWQKFGDQIGN